MSNHKIIAIAISLYYIHIILFLPASSIFFSETDCFNSSILFYIIFKLKSETKLKDTQDITNVPCSKS